MDFGSRVDPAAADCSSSRVELLDGDVDGSGICDKVGSSPSRMEEPRFPRLVKVDVSERCNP